jgi:lipid-binding SYLF domain-containing protein
MKYTVMYIATRGLRSKNIRLHIVILQEANNIDIMQDHFGLNAGWILGDRRGRGASRVAKARDGRVVVPRQNALGMLF